MKKILPVFFLMLSHKTFAQVNAVLSTEATTFHEKAMKGIKPGIKDLIEKNANKLTGRKADVDSLIDELHKNALLKGGNEKDLDAVAVLILVQASENIDNELKFMVTHMKGTEAERDSYRHKAAIYLDNKSRMAESVSALLKNISGSPEMAMEKFK